MRTQTIKLAYLPDHPFEGPLGAVRRGKGYRVISARNSVAYDPGQMLSRDEVIGLCRDAAWDVVILPLEKEKQS